MTRIFLLAALFTSVVAYGQQKNEWRIGAHYQINKGYNFGSNNSSSDGFGSGGCYGPSVPLIDRVEYTTGVDVNYRVTKNFELSSGIDVTRRNAYTAYYYGCFLPIDINAPISYVEHNYSIEAPIIARYYVLPSKFKMHFELGQIVGIPFRSFNSVPFENVQLDIHGGLGVDYFVGRFQMSASVNYRRDWMSLMATEMYYLKSDRLGIQLRTAVRLGAI